MTEPAAAFLLPDDSTPMVEAAEMYARVGLPPVPLYGLTPSGACRCGQANCTGRARGKHPMGNAWQKRATIDLDDVRDRFRSHDGNVGIFLALGRLVLIDADAEIGLHTAAEWDLPDTLTQQSGSAEGAHFIYRFADNQDPALVTDRSKIAPGIDVKARGQFAAAPSRHFSGGIYRWTRVRAPAVLPDWLFERIRTPVRATAEPASGTHAVSVPADASSLEKRARAYMAKIPPAVEGNRGHTQAFAAARALAGWFAKGLEESIATALLQEYSAGCKPPWSEKELDHKWAQAKTAHTIPRLDDRPRLRLVGAGTSGPGLAQSHDPDGVLPPDGPDPPSGGGSDGGQQPDWRAELLWQESRNGVERLVTHTENVVRILQLDPRWKGKIQFDAFRHRICIAKDLPWDQYNKPTSPIDYWTDEDATRMSGWMRREWHARRFEPSRNECDHAVIAVARTHDYNPVQDYLTSVAWDGTPRLGTWLATYLGAEQSEYTRLVGTWWLISAVARIFRPGEKVDTVPILEGPQGLKKSTALRILAGAEYFNDTPIDIGSKDAYTAIQGCWFVELAELESLMRATPTKSKAFFSSSKDRFRRAYARHERDELRQCIFVGTVNLKEYLNDPTGARRFWPITCTRIDIDALERDRDQLWAEAVAEFEEGRLWYPQAETEHELLGERQEERTYEDAWEAKVRSFLTGTKRQFVTPEMLLVDVLDIPSKDWTVSAQTRLGILMTSRVKWVKRRLRRPDGTRYAVYAHPNCTRFTDEPGHPSAERQ